MFSWSNKSLGKDGVVKRFQNIKPQPKHLCVDFIFCSNQEVHIHVKVLNKVNTFYMLTIQRFSIEWKDCVRNWMKLKNNNGMWCFSADKETYTTHHFCMKNSDFPAFFPETFSSRVCHQGAYRFGSPVFQLKVGYCQILQQITSCVTDQIVSPCYT